MIFNTEWKLYMLYVHYTPLVLYVDVGDNKAILDNLSFSFVSYVGICRAHINIHAYINTYVHTYMATHILQLYHSY